MERAHLENSRHARNWEERLQEECLCAQIERYTRRERRGGSGSSIRILLCTVNKRRCHSNNMLDVLHQRLRLELLQCRVVLVRTGAVMRRRTIWMFVIGRPAAVMIFLHGC